MRAVSLGSLGGTELKIHPAFPLLILSSVALGQWEVMRTLLIVVCLHEFGHMAAAKSLGLAVPAMELTPIGGVAKIENLNGVEPWRDLIVSLAGPATNLLLSMGTSFGVQQLGWWTGQAAQTFMRCNLALMAVNLIPALPLDGGRVGRAMLAGFVSKAKATRLFMWAGVALGGLLFAAGVYLLTRRQLNLTLFMSGPYIIYAALTERDDMAAQMVRGLSRRAEQVRKTGVLPTKWLAVSADLPISKLPAKLNARQYHMITVVEAGGLRPIGTLSENELLDALVNDQTMPVGRLVAGRR